VGVLLLAKEELVVLEEVLLVELGQMVMVVIQEEKAVHKLQVVKEEPVHQFL
jgi:hypothetical protein